MISCKETSQIINMIRNSNLKFKIMKLSQNKNHKIIVNDK